MTSLSKDEPLSATPETPDAPSGDRPTGLPHAQCRHRRGGSDDRHDMEPRGPRAAGRDGGWRSKPPRRPREAMPVSR